MLSVVAVVTPGFIEGNYFIVKGILFYNDDNNNCNYFRMVTHSAVVVYKGPSIYKQTNLLTT